MLDVYPDVFLLNRHAKKGKPHPHDSKVTMDLDQELIPLGSCL